VNGAQRIETRLRAARSEGRAALLPYFVAGFPRRAGFGELLIEAGARSDVLELGLPFSDPTADGPVIAAAAQHALAEGVHLGWLLAEVARVRTGVGAELVLMSYVNPLLAFGLERACAELARAGVSGLIVPDVPLEESGELAAASAAHGLALVQLVTPLTPPERAARLARASRGFLYVVTRAGTTGAAASPASVARALADLRACTTLPLCAGFGLRTPEQLAALAGTCDGFVVGTALVECLAAGRDPLALLDSLRSATRLPHSPPETSR
jgi:tryptophan synthase alpha chain